MRPTKSDQTMF